MDPLFYWAVGGLLAVILGLAKLIYSILDREIQKVRKSSHDNRNAVLVQDAKRESLDERVKRIETVLNGKLKNG